MSVAMAAPVAAAGARAAAGKVAGQTAAKSAAGSAAGSKAAQAAGAAASMPDLPERGSWKKRAAEGGGSPKKSGPSKFLQGEAGKSRRMLIAEFLICAMLLGLSPLAKGDDEMGPIRFMKRGSATCALFIILGLLSSAGRGAARAAAMFGALVTLVLLVDQREAFGKLATILTKNDAEEESTDAFQSSLGPDDSTATDDNPGVAAV